MRGWTAVVLLVPFGAWAQNVDPIRSADAVTAAHSGRLSRIGVGGSDGLSPNEASRRATLEQADRALEQVTALRGRMRDRLRSFYRLSRSRAALGSVATSPAALRVHARLARRVMGAQLRELRSSMRHAQALDDVRVGLTRAAPPRGTVGGGTAGLRFSSPRSLGMPAFTYVDATGSLNVRDDNGRPFVSLRGGLPLPVIGIAQMRVRARAGEFPGVDLFVGSPATARAVADGRVEFAGDYAALGKLVIIYHGGRFHTVTANLTSLTVSRGAHVAAGEEIGATSATVLFEIRRDGRPIETLSWLGLR